MAFILIIDPTGVLKPLVSVCFKCLMMVFAYDRGLLVPVWKRISVWDRLFEWD
jgi:hypothetical protein